MKRRIIKIMGVFFAGLLVLGSIGCGAQPPTKASDISDSEQQKLTAGSEIFTPADNTEVNVN
jgi:hypothetical protein